MVSRSRPDQPERALFRLLERIDRLETMVYGRSSSVTNGRTRFIGLESLIVIGSQLVSGLLTVVGRITVTGLGILEVLGLIDLTGRMRVQAGGEIVIGNVSIKDGKITVGAGGSQIVIDGATGTITVPGTIPITLRQVSGLARIDLGSTAQIWSGGDGVTVNASGGGFINVYSGGVDIGAGVGKTATITGDVKMQSLGTKPSGLGTLPVTWDPVSKQLYVG